MKTLQGTIGRLEHAYRLLLESLLKLLGMKENDRETEQERVISAGEG